MLKRIITALTLIATVFAGVLLAYFVHPVFFDLYMMLWTVTGVYEMCKCFKNSGYIIHFVPLIGMMLISFPVYYLMELYLGLGILGSVLVLIVTMLVLLFTFTLGNKQENSIKDLIANIFILIYPTFILSLAWPLSHSFADINSCFNIYSIMLALFMPIGADSFAYFTGSFLKGPKLCPTISPKKTVSGAIGGVFGSMLVAIVFYLIFDLYSLLPGIGYVPFIDHSVAGWEWKTALIYLAIGFITGVLSELCDLVASRIKRELGVKDYGNIFPGHGGAMDRLDSIISSVVVLMVAFTIIYSI